MTSRQNTSFFDKISQDIDTKIIGKKIFHFETIDSTNLYAKKLVKDASEGTIVISDIQTGGRGRKNRTWSSPKGGLWFSIILYPNIAPDQAMILTMMSSIAITEAIDVITNISPVIKWPNDILINEKKVCGILTEIDTSSEKINYAIVGVGINVNNDLVEDLQKNAISLKEAYGKVIIIEKLLKQILKLLDNYYEILMSGEREIIQNKWLEYSNIIGRNVNIVNGNKKFSGAVLNINENGSLIIKTKNGNEIVNVGDLTYQ